MLTKNEIKDIQSLYHKKQRDEQGLFIAEGPKMAQEIIDSDFELVMVYATEAWINKNRSIALPVKEISETELTKISNLQTSNEVLVVVKQKQQITEPTYEDQLTVVLDGIQDPGNMGTIIRIADWFGLKQIICSMDCVDFYNPKVVQSTMGSIARINCWYKDINEWVLPRSIPVYGALLEGENIYKLQQVKYGLLVIGNESKGIRDSLLQSITNPVTIPKKGGAESLNAAIATGIILGCMVNNN